MELRHLRTLRAVANCGTIHAAALQLDIAPSSVSDRIRELETDLDVALFLRGRSGMTLTNAGADYVEASNAALDLLDAAADRTHRHSTSSLRLGALDSIAATLLPAALDAYARRNPDTHVDIDSHADRNALLDRVQRGELAAAVILDSGARLGDLGFTPPRGRFEFVDLREVPLILVCASHSLTVAALSIDEVRQNAVVLGNQRRCSFWLATQQWLGGTAHIAATNSIAVMKEWVAQDRGVALLPQFAVQRELDSHLLTAIDVPTPSLQLRLVWQNGAGHRSEVKELLYAVTHA